MVVFEVKHFSKKGLCWVPPRYQAGISLQLKVEAQRKISSRNGQLRVSPMGAFRLGFWGVPNKRSAVYRRGTVLVKWCNPPGGVGRSYYWPPNRQLLNRHSIELPPQTERLLKRTEKENAWLQPLDRRKVFLFNVL